MTARLMTCSGVFVQDSFSSFVHGWWMQCFDPLQTALACDPFDFHELAPFNDGAFAVFRGDGVAASDWEIHHDTDEMLFAISGSVTVEILTDGTSTSIPLTAGQFTMVPRGLWHRHVDVVDLVEMYYTPGDSQQSDAPDPRTSRTVAPPAGASQ